MNSSNMRMLIRGLAAGLLMSLFSAVSAEEGYTAVIVDSLMHYIPENNEGTPLGLHYDILKAIEAELGQPIEIKMAPSLRVYETFAHNQVDMTVLVNTTRIRESGSLKVYLFSTRFYLYSLPNAPIKTVEQASGVIGRLRGGCLTLNNADIDFFELNSYEQGVEMLLRGRIQGVCGSDALFNAAESASPTNGALHRLLLTEVPVWLHLQPSMDEKRVREITRAATAVAESGWATVLLDKYLQLPFVVMDSRE